MKTPILKNCGEFVERIIEEAEAKIKYQLPVKEHLYKIEPISKWFGDKDLPKFSSIKCSLKTYSGSLTT
jgi:hypothetical protein